MTDGFSVFLIFIHTEPTVWNSLEPPHCPGGKKFLTVKMFTNDWEPLQFLRSARWFLLTLITHWKIVGMKSSIQQT